LGILYTCALPAAGVDRKTIQQNADYANAWRLSQPGPFMYTGSILAGGIAAIIAGMVQELSARLFYNHASTHVDPPSMAIAICTLLVNLLMKPEFLNLAALFH
jgi:hypothetical protein